MHLKAGVSLNRIAVYLQEDEVTEQVSSLKKDRSEPQLLGEEGLGLDHASLKWNEVEENKDRAPSTPPSSTSTETETLPDSASVAEVMDHKFELRDLSVIFPERELSLITGPTAR